MKQLKKFKVGDKVTTKFPVSFGFDKDRNEVAVIFKERISECRWAGCVECGEYTFRDGGTYIPASELNKLKVIPRIINKEVVLVLETVITKVEKHDHGIELVCVESLGNAVFDHATFLKFN